MITTQIQLKGFSWHSTQTKQTFKIWHKEKGPRARPLSVFLCFLSFFPMASSVTAHATQAATPCGRGPLSPNAFPTLCVVYLFLLLWQLLWWICPLCPHVTMFCWPCCSITCCWLACGHCCAVAGPGGCCSAGGLWPCTVPAPAPAPAAAAAAAWAFFRMSSMLFCFLTTASKGLITSIVCTFLAHVSPGFLAAASTLAHHVFWSCGLRLKCLLGLTWSNHTTRHCFWKVGYWTSPLSEQENIATLTVQFPMPWTQ